MVTNKLTERKSTRTHVGKMGWAQKFMRRVIALRPGRYQIILTIGKDADWTVQEIGKVER